MTIVTRFIRFVDSGLELFMHLCAQSTHQHLHMKRVDPGIRANNYQVA